MDSRIPRSFEVGPALVWGTIAGAVLCVLFLLLVPWVVQRQGTKGDKGGDRLRDGVWLLWIGADGRPSTSKFQFYVWTAAALFSYALLYVVQVWHDWNFQALQSIPGSLLAAMGLSALTLVASKGITGSFVTSGKVDKTLTASGGMGGLFTDDNGLPDLGKIQLLAFTFLALVIFLVQVFSHAHRNDPTLPDIDMSLVALMGIGHATYIGKKLVTTDTPRLASLAPTEVKPGDEVVVKGASLGDATCAQVTFNGIAQTFVTSNWTDSGLTFKVPSSQAPEKSVRVGVVANGIASANEIALDIKG